MIFNALAGTLALNGLRDLLVHQQALGEAPGVALVPPVDYNQAVDFGMVQLSTEPKGEPVAAVALDTFRLPRLDFLKLDVTG